ncbi:CAP-Gly domain-containing linker protein 1 [Girardinichthys multiradiatus]|uniref:CAP-Gly domain-containing linker protein 1 n=1 Tax=Girardinichthys multiradiatus TaxID=208333 RepID=UPI001FAC136D|nr:CAP-Gly domain-containing linker protein 1 [Girardinichthys multiradiatus]
MASVSGKAEKASKFEMLKLLENSRKERDEALQRENVLREKVRQNEARLRSTEGLKQKLKILTVDNKELRKQVKALRTEIGLESSPNFTGKTTKDIVNDLQEKERECNSLIEKTRKLSSTIDDLTAELSNVVTSKTLLEDQVQSLQQNLKDMTNNQRRLLKLWEDKKTQREQLALPAITQKFLTHKEVQTDMSISSYQKLPPNAFETKQITQDSDKNRDLDKDSFLSFGNGFHLSKKTLVYDES